MVSANCTPAEADIAQSRVRYESEWLLDCYDELNDKKVSSLYVFAKVAERNLPKVVCISSHNDHTL